MNNFLGNWKITEMEAWDQNFVDLIEPGYIKFNDDNLGELLFGAVSGSLDYRVDTENKPQKVEFSLDGVDEGDPVSGRGWAVIEKKNQIYGMLFFHLGDESWFKAIKR